MTALTHCPHCRKALAPPRAFTPYNTDALTRIGNGACARELGWDDEFYKHICRKHGLGAVASQSLKTHIAPEIAPEATPPALPTPTPTTTAHGFFNAKTRDLHYGAMLICMPRRQADVFLHICAGTPAKPANGHTIAQRIDLQNTDNIGGHVLALRNRLKAIGIKIDAARTRSRGGYWLVDAATGAVITIKVTR